MLMNNKLSLVSYKVFFALLALSAVVTQMIYGITQDNFNATNFYSYFTIESNIFALVMFLVSAKAVYTGKRDANLDHLRGAATLYMLITGFIYSILLTGVDVNTPLPWVNTVLHYLFPLVVLIDWLVDRPAKAITTKKALLWLGFPLAYFVYSLVRGHYVGWYPYPFMNAANLGYAEVAINAVVIAIGMAGLAVVVAKIGKPATVTKKR